MNIASRTPDNASKNFDERQLAARRRVGTFSFFLLAILVLVNGIITDYTGPWASPLTQGLVLFWVSVGFFTVMSIWHGAFLTGKGDSAPYRILAAVTALVSFLSLAKKAVIGPSIDLGGPGHEGTDLTFLVMGLYFTAVVVAQFLRQRRDRREAFAEDDLD
ncbi:hypothetical protein [Arthrobacter sp. UM1]|uniref:hypothetical protein n=1 Tax=Arthrobacter sp. UM1 TaxID=2766776 RepID=UPI001CF6E352|nr:hypothetical protein [Arthrobacter sp. UM1]MCB4208788.1 hypothetical protein [Arthrobacter sp. UM1]